MEFIMLCPVLLLSFLSFVSSDTLRVGIVGGGIGGSATAYFLKQYLKDQVEITLYEASALGGRLAARLVGKNRYETGGAVAIERNRYISALVEELGLKRRGDFPPGFSSIFDGQKVVFAESKWKAVTVAELMWRYGSGIYFINSHIDKRLDLFDRIYDHQANLKSFDTLNDLLKSMDPSFIDDMKLPVDKGFRDEGLQDAVIDELVACTLRVNYGQHFNVHKFVGAVSVAGVGKTMFSIEGGNYRVPERLVQESKAKVVYQTVKRMLRLPSGKIQLQPASRSDIPPDGQTFPEFDAVVVATPLTADMPNRIEFLGFEEEISFNGMYHRTVSTLLRGNLKVNKFEGAHTYTDEILTSKPGGVINSISRVYPVNSGSQKSDVWKVFSQRPLTTDELSEYFDDLQDVSVTDWLAYPEYNTSPRNDKFLLSKNLYHLNAIEWAASAMEMSLISAKNIAISIRNTWCADKSCDDQLPSKHEPSDEL